MAKYCFSRNIYRHTYPTVHLPQNACTYSIYLQLWTIFKYIGTYWIASYSWAVPRRGGEGEGGGGEGVLGIGPGLMVYMYI
jgi:hypothetical protein